jgi:hypothetical protein
MESEIFRPVTLPAALNLTDMLNFFSSASATARMRPTNFIVRYAFLVLVAYSCASQALSIDKSPAKPSIAKSSDLLRSYVWYDGHQKRKVWLNPNLVAEFRGGPPEKSLLLKNYPEASVRHIHHAVRIWESPARQFSATLLNSGKSSDSTPSVYSPIFHDAPTESGRMRALPGNVIVYLNPEWDRNKVAHWMETQGFEVANKLEIRSNAYVLKTGPGMEALQTANTLYESGEVVAAFPDWWLESVMR